MLLFLILLVGVLVDWGNGVVCMVVDCFRFVGMNVVLVILVVFVFFFVLVIGV